MTTVVVPFRGTNGKSRLALPQSERRELALRMLRRVLDAAAEVGDVVLVTDDEEARSLAAHWVADPARGDPGGRRRDRRGGRRHDERRRPRRALAVRAALRARKCRPLQASGRGRRRSPAARRGSRHAVRVAVLAGGVGAARFLRGLVEATDREGITAIGNVGDDLEVLGLSVSPDLDSVLYALAGRSDEERGW